MFDKQVDPSPWQVGIATRNQKNPSSLLERLILARTLSCAAEIRDEYLKHYFFKSTLIFLIVDRQGDPRGLIMCKNFADQHGSGIEIGLVCSSTPSGGELLIRMVEQYAFDHAFPMVRLYALQHVVGYYRKLGYVNGWTCKEPSHIAILWATSRNNSFFNLLQNTSFAVRDGSADEWTYPMTKCVLSKPADSQKHIRRSKRASPYHR